MNALKRRLDAEVERRNCVTEVCEARPDPIWVASRTKDPLHSLACALFGYGNANLIVRFLDTLDFDLFEAEEPQIRSALRGHYYRFQTPEDVTEFFIAMRRLKLSYDLETLFLEGYGRGHSVVEGLNRTIETLRSLNPYRSRGYDFLLGRPVERTKGASALKRWMMFLRWMVRSDEIDFGLWTRVSTADLIMPLDTHTFNVSRRLGLLERSRCDLHAAMLLTERLKRFDPEDPLKYDFALYRIGQEQLPLDLTQ